MTKKHKRRNGSLDRKYKRIAPLDIRVTKFKMYYLQTESHTFMNARGSAIRAGYSENYANNITRADGPYWFGELAKSIEVKRALMLKKAEDNLMQSLIKESDDITDKKIKHDATKFVAERIGKEVYSTRQEVTGKNGRKLFDEEKKKELDTDLKRMFVVPAPDSPEKQKKGG